MAAGRIANDERLRAVAARQPYPLLFVTVSGAHLYGFPSASQTSWSHTLGMNPAAYAISSGKG
jgi:hypothetical protein